MRLDEALAIINREHLRKLYHVQFINDGSWDYFPSNSSQWFTSKTKAWRLAKKFAATAPSTITDICVATNDFRLAVGWTIVGKLKILRQTVEVKENESRYIHGSDNTSSD